MKVIISALMATTLISACATTQPSKADREHVTVTKTLGNYTSIDAATGIQVTYNQGTATPAVINAPKYILDYLEIEVKGKTLNIKLSSDYFSTFQSMNEKVTVTVSAPAVNNFEASSGASITVSKPVRINGDLDIETSSGASIRMETVAATGKTDIDVSSGSGVEIATLTTDKLECDASSGASINLSKVSSRQASCDVSSGADCKIASGSTSYLKVDASSGGSFNGRNFRATKAKIDSNSGGSVHYNSQQASESDSRTGSATNHR